MNDQYANGDDLAPLGADPTAAQDAGYTICIKVAGDGSLSVGLENEAAEMAAAPGSADGEAAEESGYRPAEDIKDALTQALSIYKADGQATAESQFDSGFSGKVTK